MSVKGLSGLGDLMNACFSLPQNPLYRGVTQYVGAGNCPMFTPGNGRVSPSMPLVGTASIPTSLPVSSAWLVGGGGASTVTTTTASITPGSPAATSLPQATTQVSPSITQTPPAPNYGQSQTPGWIGHWNPSMGPSMGNNFIGYQNNETDSKVNINPAVLLQPLPKIALNQAVNLKCEDGGIASWVGNNPMLAGLALVGLFFALNKG